MPEVEYQYLLPRRDERQLDDEVRAAGPWSVPFLRVLGSGDRVLVVFDGAPSGQDLARLDGVLAAHTGRRRRPKGLRALAQEVFDLPAADRLKLFCLLAAAQLRADPAVARAWDLAIRGDEPDPDS